MKTDDLIHLLAGEVTPVVHRPVGQRYAAAIGAALPFSALLMWTLLGLRADLSSAIALPMFWLKLAFPAVLAAFALPMVKRVSVPGKALGNWPAGLALPVVAMWGLAAWRFQSVPADQDAQLLLGQTWSVCPWLIMLLSAPVFVAVLTAMRTLAPTQLRQAGAVAGLLSGSFGAMVYSLHCPEMEPAFLGTWYLMGILLTAGVGALLGKAMLRW